MRLSFAGKFFLTRQLATEPPEIHSTPISRRRHIPVIEGDTVHHPHHGIGKVQSIRTRSFSGVNKSRFAKLFFKRDKVTLMLRETDLDDVVRPPVDAKEASKLLQHIKKWSGKVSTQWKARANAHQKTMEQGDPYGYAEVYKGLSRMEQEGKLRAMDRAHLNQSTKFLSEELANALGKSEEEICAQMTKVSRVKPAGTALARE